MIIIYKIFYNFQNTCGPQQLLLASFGLVFTKGWTLHTTGLVHFTDIIGI